MPDAVRESTILCIDDQRPSLELLKAVLVEFFPEMRIQTAVGGPSGLLLAARELPDLIILDAKMPGMDGFEVCHRLKTDPVTSSIPILMASGVMVETMDRVSGLDCGADSYICKPFVNEELVAQVNALLRIKHKEDDLRDREEKLEQELEERTHALRQSEERFRQLFERSPVAIWVQDEDGILLEVNTAGVRLFGLDHRSLVGSSVRSRLPAEDFPRLRKTPAESDADAPIQLETVLHAEAGAQVPVDLQVARTDYGGVPALLVHARDITRRKQMQEELRRREDILEAVSFAAKRFLQNTDWHAAIPEFLARIGKAADVSRAYIFTARETGNAVRLLSQQFEWAAPGVSHELDNPDLQDHNMTASGLGDVEAILARGDVWQGHTRDLPPEGRLFLASQRIQSLMLVPIFVRQQGWGLLGFDECRCERIWSPAEVGALQAAADILSAAIQRSQSEERERELHSRLTRAQRMESIGLLAGGVAHDLNNILGPVVGYPDLLLASAPADAPYRADLKEIRDSALQASAVIQDLLTLSRSGTTPHRPVDLNDVVVSFMTGSTYQALRTENPGTEVETALDDARPCLAGSKSHLLRVLANLVTNAFEAMPAGGRLRLATRREHLREARRSYETIEPGEYALLEVDDTGTGIEPDKLDRIFEPFYTTHKRGRSGTGLGLAVVYGVVKDLHGFIDVESTPGRGTSFTLYFPLVHERPEEQKERQELLRGTEKLLVVDDTREQRELARHILSHLGYDVVTVENGPSALEHLRHARADLVLLDMIMEDGFDGLDTFREILKLHPGQKCVICSGFAETARVKEAQELGAGRYLRKPYTVGGLSRAIREELDRSPSASPKP